MKRKLLTKQERLQIFQKYNGHCAYCGCELEYKDMQVDHIKPLFRGYTEAEKEKWLGQHYGNNDMDNLNPSCRMCNFRKGTNSVDGFRNELEHSLVCVNRDFTYRIAKKYGLIYENPHRVVFYFETHKA